MTTNNIKLTVSRSLLNKSIIENGSDKSKDIYNIFFNK